VSDSRQAPRQKALAIFDAGPIVGFAAAGRPALLVEVFDRVHVHRAVAFAVDKEIRRQGLKYAGVTKRWAAVATSGRFKVLAEVAVGLGDQRVVAEAARLRDTDPDSALNAQRDLGEVLTVAHAVVDRQDGLNVVVSIDDSYGARLAAAERFQNLDTVTIVRLAIRLGIITAKADLRTLYGALSRYSNLPLLAVTGLLEEKFT